MLEMVVDSFENRSGGDGGVPRSARAEIGLSQMSEEIYEYVSHPTIVKFLQPSYYFFCSNPFQTSSNEAFYDVINQTERVAEDEYVAVQNIFFSAYKYSNWKHYL